MRVDGHRCAAVAQHMRRHSRIVFPFDPFRGHGGANGTCHVTIFPSLRTSAGGKRHVTIVVTTAGMLTKLSPVVLSIEDERLLWDLADFHSFSDGLAATTDCHGCVKHDAVQVDDRHNRPLLRGFYCREHGTVSVVCASLRHDYVKARGQITGLLYTARAHDKVVPIDGSAPHFSSCSPATARASARRTTICHHVFK